MMLNKCWIGYDGKYVSDEISCCSWRKADILPLTWNTDINKNVGSATLAHIKKVISDDLFNALCNLMKHMKVKSHTLTEIFILPAVFQSYFVVDPKCSPKDMEDMLSIWVNIWDERESVDAIFDEYLENIDDVSGMNIDIYDDDCEE